MEATPKLPLNMLQVGITISGFLRNILTHPKVIIEYTLLGNTLILCHSINTLSHIKVSMVYVSRKYHTMLSSKIVHPM